MQYKTQTSTINWMVIGDGMVTKFGKLNEQERKK